VENKSHRAAGKRAEDLACEYLSGLGWEIIERNYYSGHAEVDIIAKDGTFIVFVEVKMRSGTTFGTPIEFVNEAQVERIFNVAENWVQENEAAHLPLRFDIIGILKKGRKLPEITHLQDAFR